MRDEDPSAVAVVAADRGREREQFLTLPYTLYRDDPAFVPPLRLERRQFLDPRRNAFFDHAEVALFLARRGGRPCGRISAQIDREEERASGVKGATFGLFEAEDGETAGALLARAEEFARGRGRSRLRGPFSLSVNQESGLLVSGFALKPMVLMPHGRPGYDGWLQAAGLVPARDLYAWRLRAGHMPPAFRRAAEKCRATPGLSVRPLDRERLEDDLVRVREVFNQAWADNWGFVPLTDRELRAMAADLRRIADPRITALAEIGGRPVAIAIGLPDLNQALDGLGGRLLPLGWLRLLWRLKVRRLSAARLALFGVLRGQRGVGGMGLVALLLTEMHDRALAAGYLDWEISWVLEDNRAANQGAEAMGAVKVKTYRLYEKDLR